MPFRTSHPDSLRSSNVVYCSQNSNSLALRIVIMKIDWFVHPWASSYSDHPMVFFAVSLRTNSISTWIWVCMLKTTCAKLCHSIECQSILRASPVCTEDISQQVSGHCRINSRYSALISFDQSDDPDGFMSRGKAFLSLGQASANLLHVRQREVPANAVQHEFESSKWALRAAHNSTIQTGWLLGFLHSRKFEDWSQIYLGTLILMFKHCVKSVQRVNSLIHNCPSQWPCPSSTVHGCTP